MAVVGPFAVFHLGVRVGRVDPAFHVSTAPAGVVVVGVGVHPGGDVGGGPGVAVLADALVVSGGAVVLSISAG